MIGISLGDKIFDKPVFLVCFSGWSVIGYYLASMEL